MVTALVINAIFEGTSQKPLQFPCSRVRGENRTSYMGEDYEVRSVRSPHASACLSRAPVRSSGGFARAMTSSRVPLPHINDDRI